ncbi:MAG: hypothetical protein ABIS47_03880 [Acidimicrobiales bacterium]
MTKRIIAAGIAIVAVLGLAGAAFAAGAPERPSYGFEDAALALAADPAPPAPAAGTQDRQAKRQALRDCVKTKVDAGGERRAALKECATQLGITPKAGKAGPRRPLRGAVHADLVVPKKGADGQFETIQVDRGKVAEAKADSITLTRPDGPTVTLKVVPGTKVRGAAAAADLAPGREVAVVSAGGEARSIVAKKP